VITLVGYLEEERETSANSRDRVEYKEAFALFDKKGTGAIPREDLGDLLRALGQNPTQAEVADIISKAPREGEILPCFGDNPRVTCLPFVSLVVDYKSFLAILNRVDGFKPAGTPGA
jgi:calmodulin